MAKIKENQKNRQTNDEEDNVDESLVIDLTKLKKEMDTNPGMLTDLDAVFNSATIDEETQSGNVEEDEDEPTKEVKEKKSDQSDEDDNQEEQEEDNEDNSDDDEDEKENKNLSRSEKRIVELNAKKKEAEQARKAAEQRAEDAEQRLKNTQISSSKRNYEITKSALESQIQLAEQDYMRAQSEGDNAASSKAISRMTMAQTQLVAIDAALEQITNSLSTTDKDQQQQQSNTNVTEVQKASQKMAAKWVRNNKRVYTDQKFAGLVSQLTNQLIAEGDFSQDSEEYWEALDELIVEIEGESDKKESNSSGNKKQQNKSPVSGQRTSKSEMNKSNQKNKDIVTLSPEQAATARSLGISYEDYALELQNETDFVILPKRK